MCNERDLKERIDEAEAKASEKAITCDELLRNKGLKEAIAYCNLQGVEPPQCSLTAQSANADRLREKAARMLSETTWWKRRLRNKAKQDFEFEQISKGKVTNVVSDASLRYDTANRKLR